MENKKYIFLCSAYPKEYDEFFHSLSGDDSTISGNIHSMSVLDGLKSLNFDYFAISGVSVGHYPLNTKTKKLPEIQFADDFYSVAYNNHVLKSQKSKERAMIKCFKEHCKFKNEPLNILIADIHEPFIRAALKIKKFNKDSRIVNICLDVPDTIVSSNNSLLRRALKKISVKRNLKLLKKIDGFVLLSDLMKERLPVNKKPYIVLPCLSDLNLYNGFKKDTHSDILVVYCGVLSLQYNIDLLLNAFSLINKPNYKLLLAGKGDGVPSIKEYAKKDERIQYLGEITRNEALQLQLNADVLVNPRLPEQNYTSYSFPSKTISYLLSGNPLVCYTFASFPKDIKDMVFEPKKTDAISLANAIISCSRKKSKVKYNALEKYSSKESLKRLNELFEITRSQNE